MGLCQELLRFAVARKKLLFYAAVVFVTGLNLAYLVYSIRVNTENDLSWFGGQYNARRIPPLPLKLQTPDEKFVRRNDDSIVIAIG